MKNKKKKIDPWELDICMADAICRIEAAGLVLPRKYNNDSQPPYDPTFWQRQGGHQYGYNSKGYTGEVRCAA